MNDEAGGELPDRSKRIYVMWAAGFAFLGLLAIFCVYFLRPYMEVRAAVKRINAGKDDYEGAVKFLGGPEQAAAKVSLYVRCPERLAAKDEKESAFKILAACGPPAFPWAESLLHSRDEVVRAGAAFALGELKDPRAVEPLIGALKDSGIGVRQLAAGALGELNDPRAVEPLIGTLKDSEIAVRWVAAVALGRLKDPRAVDPLIDALTDSNADVRRWAANTLGELNDPRAVDPLIGALKDSDFSVRWRAAGALGELKDRRAVEPLKVLLADPDNSVRKAAEAAIKKIGLEPRP